MASHDVAVNTLLNNGLRQRQLETVLASNCVMDWFGRTFIGQQKVIHFYQNMNASYEHSMSGVEATEAFEDRPYHILTREQPLENLKITPDLAGDEQWFDCETHSPVDLKEGQRTPVQKATPSHCPPAPYRYGLKFQPDSDDELGDDDDDLDLSGVEPLETTETLEKSPKCKRMKREEKETIVVDPSESKFSELRYLEATGNITINRQASSSDEAEKRECKMFVSYRVNKEDSSVVQIALIVYKSNSMNPKTRRNLMCEFEQKTSELMSSNLSTSSRCRTVASNRKKLDVRNMEVSTEPAKTAKAVKRPLMTKTSLRF